MGPTSILEIPAPPRHIVLESDPPLTDEEFEKLCLVNDQFQLERTKEGKIEVNPLIGGFTGNANNIINFQLTAWWDTHEQGLVFDSSTGFVLPDTSIMGPDAAYIREAKARKSLKKRDNIFCLCVRTS